MSLFCLISVNRFYLSLIFSQALDTFRFSEPCQMLCVILSTIPLNPLLGVYCIHLYVFSVIIGIQRSHRFLSIFLGGIPADFLYENGGETLVTVASRSVRVFCNCIIITGSCGCWNQKVILVKPRSKTFSVTRYG